MLRNISASIALVIAALASGLIARAQSTAATFGQVINLSGTPSDLVLDESRRQLYLVNTAANRVDILSTTTNAVVGNITVGATPLAAAMSMDNSTLYVTNSGTQSVSVIDLNTQQVTLTTSLPAAPQGIEVGADGRALITTSGTTGGANTLLLFDKTPTAIAQLVPVVTPPPPSAPAPLPGTPGVRPDTTFFSKLVRTPDGKFIVGLFSPTTTSTYMFVYEVASGTILRSRTVTGQSTVLAMSPDGSRFMAGFTLYDVGSLSVLGQMNNANAPFPFASVFNVRQNIGGSVFSPDGRTIYGAFNVAAFSNPAAPANSSTLLLTDPTNLAIRMGIRLPESIVARMAISSDGANVWCLSVSGLVYLPMSKLYTYPILAPSTTQVFLSQNPCNPGLAQAAVRIANAGSGKLTFAVNTISSALTSSVSTGVAPSTITFTMEPGRLGVVRQAGTNIATGAATLSGQPLDVTLASNDAINIPPTIRVYMNLRSSDQRGIVFPVPVTPNNSPTFNQINGTAALIGGDQGLEDILIDQPRKRVYITNAGYNRVEVFDTVSQSFLSPIPVGQLPHQMALSTDNNFLYVACTGGELIDIIDLSTGIDIGHVNYPPIPRQAGGVTAALIYPQSMAVAINGLEFVMSNGTQWRMIGSDIVPRPSDAVTRQTNGSNTLPAPVTMLASPDNTRIVTLAGTGTAYVYDAASDAYVSSAALFGVNGAIQGFYGPMAAGPLNSWFTLGGLYTKPSLSVLGGSANASANTSGAQRNVVATAAFDQNNFIRLSTPVRASLTAAVTSEARPTIDMVNVNTSASRLLAIAPENGRFTALGTTRFNIPARSMVVDNNNIAYIITLSGLSVVPLTPNGVAAPQLASTRTILNAQDGSTNLRIGGVININGSSLASTATAPTLPAPTVLGGSCVTFNDVALPLLQTSSGQIQAQLPATLSAGANIVQVRSLATGTQSLPVTVTVQTPSGSSGGASGAPSVVDGVRGSVHLTPQ